MHTVTIGGVAGRLHPPHNNNQAHTHPDCKLYITLYKLNHSQGLWDCEPYILLYKLNHSQGPWDNRLDSMLPRGLRPISPC